MFPEKTLYSERFIVSFCKTQTINVLIGAQCDSVVVIHGKRLQII